MTRQNKLCRRSELQKLPPDSTPHLHVCICLQVAAIFTHSTPELVLLSAYIELARGKLILYNGHCIINYIMLQVILPRHYKSFVRLNPFCHELTAYYYDNMITV